MKIFLTGASGMLGKNLLAHPSASQHEWICPSSAKLNMLQSSEVLACMQSVRPDLVIHAAGRVGGIQANMREPVRFLLDNLDMGRNVLTAAAATGVTRLLNFGSTCMYPRDRQTPLQEGEILTGPLEPTNEGYALAKITVARLAAYLSQENPALQYKTIIPCNLYGPHDKFDPGRSHMIPAALHKLHQAKERGQREVEVWGTGEARREFLYVGDLCEAVFRGVSDLESMPALMNIGLGHDYSVNEYYQAAASVVGFQGEFQHDLTKPEGMQRKLSSVERASQWGWSPSHSLEEGLRRTYDYYLTYIAERSA